MRRKIISIFTGVMMCCMIVIPGTITHAAEISERGGEVKQVESNNFVTKNISEEDNARGILTTKYRVSVTKVTMRSGPGTNYSSIGTLYKNDVVWVRTISNGWAKFKVNSRWHYIPNSSIKKATY